ncbi:HAMP domain-containing histidine kinase [Sulfitobacter pseudonitzschiae]|uniref:histidine kinase n=1 Tax=Pseudosulfitobacter pseudonitzschiae TaxID=1402135 RepID=A0A9Q2P058_9RHOB|nr:HAMP domain-containing sensor histidine kinase [Pseudosulfitobacter pseudonitzschiae]MBM2291975.1 HAMP domain-containing histidine kinase [Pseudosulfitobacter pseudonitzschiae]MBM2296893.1 HAMP domain-containing histidine kinase [Pseudosulfitobacter pseudonitzschiae]MBM2301807.1 HAMP domain-containing histidine kinase [Pseudosulfitobacter pseudonitzschiae]MBM2311589.1 HAMP domain-containing histidine kinase [Pseudosulfitobacter pseudonitzschiae]MBM2316503.1 HAMP domain-containing histidine 
MLRKLRILVLGSLFILLALIVISMTSVRERISGLDGGNPTGPIWFVTGIEYDLLQLELELKNYTLGRSGPEDVNRRFDILWSRLIVIQKGDTAEKLDRYQVDRTVLDSLFAMLKANDSLVVNLPQQIAQDSTVREFLDKIVTYNSPLRNLSLDVLQASSRASKIRREELADINTQSTILTGMVVAAFVVLGALQILETAQTKRSLKEKERLLRDATAAGVAKSQFISVMNHELRTPLTSIRGAVTLLNAGAAGVFPDKAKRLLDMVQKNSEQLSLLIEDILEIEKLMAGRFELRTEIVDMGALIADELPNFNAYAKASDVTVVLNTQTDGALVEVDTKRMRQVLSNLVHNAVKFSRPGNAVHIDLTQSADEVVIAIADKGIGIPDDALPKIFDSFYQVDSSDSRNTGGTGLGLSIVKNLVEAMRGNVSVTSQVDQGTTFYVVLPVASVVAQSNMQAAE